jgi:uncharacterized protein with HEPN domain
MPRDPRAYLWDVREAADRIASFIRDRDMAAFVADDLVASAVERQLEIIGEALSQLSTVAPDVARQIDDLPKIVGLRNVIIHAYIKVRRDWIWRDIRADLPRLRKTVDALLKKMGPGPA